MHVQNRPHHHILEYPPHTYAVMNSLSRGEFIECLADNCRERDIFCIGSDHQCVVECTDEMSCFNSKIICAPNAPCSVTCDAPYSCLFAAIECPSNADCRINGVNINSMSSTSIDCPESQLAACDVQCEAPSSCQHVLVDATEAGQLHLDCAEFNSCWNFKLYCPAHAPVGGAKHCKISGLAFVISRRWMHETSHFDFLFVRGV